ncbi:hypothetical protein AMTRI_Chr03g49510 [Amborella trichopoda]|uniref:Uncharacterized protein n=1 Tax=Amborella trichopoda TaxID=13333 RepID=W1NGI9_AMBTC|nr:hypothetical protein AMTR_s00011p00108390 [Amborella trichopoda]
MDRDSTLEPQYTRLFSMAQNKGAKVAESDEFLGDQLTWSPKFQRHLMDEEINDMISLLVTLNHVFTTALGRYKLTWTPLPSRLSMLTSIYKQITSQPLPLPLVTNNV